MEGARVQDEADGLEILSDDECLGLLRERRFGRVAISLDALPAVLPVNYRVIDESIVFFTGTGLKLRAAMSHAVVAFQVDDIDEDAEEGWSVLAVGVAEVVDDPAVLLRVGETGLRPWAGGDRTRLVQLRCEIFTGRRISAA